MKSFPGFVGFYRRFIPKFSLAAKPLHELTQGVKGSGPNKKLLSRLPFHWSQIHQEAFDRLVELCYSAPTLAFADYKRPFILHTDASGLGLGAVLYQQVDGNMHLVAFASRGLNRAERNYPALKLTFLALKWAVTYRFRDYLFGASFKVFTDNNPPLTSSQQQS